MKSSTLFATLFLLCFLLTFSLIKTQESNQDAGKRILKKSELAALILDNQKDTRQTRNLVQHVNKKRSELTDEFDVDRDFFNTLRVPLEPIDSAVSAQFNISTTILNYAYTLECPFILQFECFEDLISVLNSKTDNVSLVLKIEDIVEASFDSVVTYLSRLPDGYKYEHILVPLKAGLNYISYSVILNSDNRPNDPNSFFKDVLRSVITGCEQSEPVRKYISDSRNYNRDGKLMTRSIPSGNMYRKHGKARFLSSIGRFIGDAAELIVSPVAGQVSEKFVDLVKVIADISQNPIDGLTSIVIDTLKDGIEKVLQNISLSIATIDQLFKIVSKTKNPLSAASILSRLLVSQIDLIRFTAFPFPESINPTVPIFRAISKLAIAFSDDVFSSVDKKELQKTPVKVIPDVSPPSNIDKTCLVPIKQFYDDCLEQIGSFEFCQTIDEELCNREALPTPP